MPCGIQGGRPLAERDQPFDPRHHDRHQPHHRAQGRQGRRHRHRGVPRRARDHARDSRAPLRPALEAARAAGTAPPAARGHGAHRRARRGRRTARRGERAPGGEDAARGARRRDRGLSHALVRQHRARGAGRGIIAEMAPELPVSVSSKVCREIREYERASTTVVNAYAMPRRRRLPREDGSRTAARTRHQVHELRRRHPAVARGTAAADDARAVGARRRRAREPLPRRGHRAARPHHASTWAAPASTSR